MFSFFDFVGRVITGLFDQLLGFVSVLFSNCFWEGFLLTPNFIIFCICIALFAVGLCLKRDLARGLCLFWGAAGAIGAIVVYLLIG